MIRREVAFPAVAMVAPPRWILPPLPWPGTYIPPLAPSMERVVAPQIEGRWCFGAERALCDATGPLRPACVVTTNFLCLSLGLVVLTVVGGVALYALVTD